MKDMESTSDQEKLSFLYAERKGSLNICFMTCNDIAEDKIDKVRKRKLV